jgi:hypothetical protein
LSRSKPRPPATGRAPRPGRAPARPERSWAFRLVRNVLLWALPVAAFWALLTPVYNRFLLGSAENVVHMTESPDVTDLYRHPDNYHDAYVGRRDFPPKRTLVYPFRVTDLHFHWILLGALFLGVPGVPWQKRLENLGWASLATIFFHIFLLFFVVKFAYATQLGAWSASHYSPLARNVYGLGKVLLDLPFKLALPFLLWAGFYFRLLLPRLPAE